MRWRRGAHHASHDSRQPLDPPSGGRRGWQTACIRVSPPPAAPCVLLWGSSWLISCSDSGTAHCWSKSLPHAKAAERCHQHALRPTAVMRQAVRTAFPQHQPCCGGGRQQFHADSMDESRLAPVMEDEMCWSSYSADPATAEYKDFALFCFGGCKQAAADISHHQLPRHADPCISRNSHR